MLKRKIKDKILQLNDLPRIREINKDKKIVFCTGCYDLVHSGHAVFFEKCKEHGDVLVVGVGRDSVLKFFKGENRPIISEQNRVFLIAALEAVDYAILNQEEIEEEEIDMRRTFELLRPNVYCMNDDNSKIEINRKFAEEFGAEFVLMKRDLPQNLQTLSTSEIIKKIKQEIS